MEMEQLLLEPDVKVRRPDFVKLYKQVFPQVARYVAARGGSLDEAKDVFQDSLVILFEKLNSDYPIVKTEREYLIGVSKNLWINRYRQKSKEQPLESSIQDHELGAEHQVNSLRILRFLEKSGRKCMDMLQSFYYEKLTLEEIAQKFKFSGIRSATVQKYKCIEKVRDMVKQKSLDYEDFLE
jgi:RNA polymerase sigma factor (sigma-70 family)